MPHPAAVPPQPAAMPAVKSADRVLDVFELLAGPGNERSHTDIAQALAIPKSSLSPLLATLQARGYLAFSHERRTWRLGPRWLHMAAAQQQAPDLATLAVPVLQALTEACRESSALNLLDGDESVVAAAVMGPLRLVSQMHQGDRAPLYATSGGKVLLAFMEAAPLQAYMSSVRFVRLTPRTLGGVTALRRELATVRRDGVAFSREEFTTGIVGMAVPLLRPGLGLAGAINVALPAVRFDAAESQRIAGLLRDSAALLVRRLGR